MDSKRPLASLYSMFATFAIVAYLGWSLGAGQTVLREIEMFVRGAALQIESGNDLESMLRHLFVVVALALPAAIVAGQLSKLLLGESGEHAVSDGLLPSKEMPLFKAFFVVMALEELFARALFLGLFRQIPGLDGTIGFYVLFLIGNGIWALIHLSNFEDEKDRHPLRTLPQFVAGIFFSYMYMKFGFMGALLTHTAYNAVLFASAKAQRVNIIDVLIVAYSAIVAYFTFNSMERPLSDALQLLQAGSSLTIDGWSFWDYVKLSVFASFVTSALAGLLLYDQSDLGSSDSSGSGGSGDAPLLAIIIGIVVFVGIALAILILVVYFLSWLLGFVIADLATRALVLSILFCFGQKSRSGSAVARAVWISIPTGFIGICVLYALGFWAALACCGISTCLSIPLLVLKKLDD